jgi:hypothetical protein
VREREKSAVYYVFVLYISRDGHPSRMKNPLKPSSTHGADVAAAAERARTERATCELDYILDSISSDICTLSAQMLAA